MATHVYDDAVVDVVGPESVISEPYTIKVSHIYHFLLMLSRLFDSREDLYLRTITSRQLDFSTPFTLVSTAAKTTKIHAFVLYFDTFFTASGEAVPEKTEVRVVREGDPVLAEIWPLGGKRHPARRLSSGDPLKAGAQKPKISSFSTGPASMPTHWKQTLFLLREPITANEGKRSKNISIHIRMMILPRC